MVQRFVDNHSKYGVQKKNPTLPDTIVSELEWDYGASVHNGPIISNRK